MKIIGQALSRLNGLATGFCGIIVLALVLHVTAEVVMRYVFGAPLKGTIQFVSLYYMTAISFVALGAVEERDSHISVEVLTNLMPYRAVAVCTVAGTLMSTLVAAGLTFRSWGEAMTQFRQQSFVMEGGFSLPTWPTYYFLPIGFGLMMLVAGWKLICLLTGRSTGLIHAGFDPGAPIFKDDAGI